MDKGYTGEVTVKLSIENRKIKIPIEIPKTIFICLS